MGYNHLMRHAILHRVMLAYPADTSPSLLYRHHRIARYIVRAASGAWVLMFAVTAEFMLTKQTENQFLFGLLIGSMAVGMVLMFPAIVAFFWVQEIEVELARCHLKYPLKERLNATLARDLVKILFWVAVLVLGVHFVL